MATQPTNLPVPSESPRDLKFNAGKIDEFVTSKQREYEDRFGNKHYTVEGLRWVAQQAISAFGYITLKSFQLGAPLPNNELTLPNQVLQDESDGEYYRWDGTFPKQVPAGSTPQSTGGVGAGAWLSVGDAILRSYIDTNFKTKVINFESITQAINSDLLPGSTISISAEDGLPKALYNVTDKTPQAGHIFYVRTIFGLYLTPSGGTTFSSKVTPQLSYSVLHLPEIGLITDAAVQGAYFDNITQSVLLGFSRKVTDIDGEHEVVDIYEYEFNDGVFGNIIKIVTDIPAGHGDYYCIVYRNDSRYLVFHEPKTTLSSDSFSGGYISTIKFDAVTPVSTKQRLLDLSSDQSRQTVGAYGDKLWINRVGISSNVCDIDQVFNGIFSPESIVPWSALSDVATITIPEQNFVASPVGDGSFMAITGAESHKKGHCWLTSNVPYKNLETTPIYWNAVYSEPEVLFHYWSASGGCYKTILLSWEWSTQSLRVSQVQGSGGFGWKLHQVTYPGRTYNSWGGNVSVAEVTNILSAKQGIAVGGQLGSSDDYTPTDFMIEQWSSSASGRSGARFQYGKTPYTNTQLLFDEYNDSTYPHGWRFSTVVSSTTSPALQVMKDHVFVGAFATKSQMTTNPYKDFMLHLRPASKDYCGVYIDSSSGKPGVVTASGGATLASTAQALRFGGYTTSTQVFDQYLQILSTGYTWNVPAASDRRLKYDIEYLSPESCLDRVLKMKPADYSRIRDKKRARGFIAQDANGVDRLLGERNNGVYGVHFEAVAADNTGAIIALNNKIEELKGIISQLCKGK
ncbi:tail fiber domain-containing protein [Pseudocitrobacter sp. RIT415]|uniref:tail fiber/spike domain-containing protein n=1 Tax=Pseudocitrobacter sp. RIT415 TaxID=2202163 RepID=UPI000D3B2733|nr:tail fiber domain-containing protein [Pseudocitrobacter sp. RIT 415]RAU44003.1 tail fiber domain-containing protein [Pseudocitrobacter sp. RIT 415]